MKKIQFREYWEAELTKKYVIEHDKLTPKGKKVSEALFLLEEFRRRYAVGFYKDENIIDELGCLIIDLKDLKWKNDNDY